jgi:8-amino-7-oxononanoate synthase
MASLEKTLQRCEPDSLKLVVVDGVFSMEGDLADLPGIVAVKDKYNCAIMVDEAHGLGVLGDHGRGVCNHYGLTDQVEIIMGTFSKSLAAIGGFIAADKDIINFVRHHSRAYIFSASNTPAATAAARAALQIMKNEPERIEHLWKLTDYALNSFRQLGFEIGKTSTPIIPLYIRDMVKTFTVTKMLFDEGVFVNPVVPPACSPDDTLIRFSLMATHTKEQVDFAIDKLVKCFKALEILK